MKCFHCRQDCQPKDGSWHEGKDSQVFLCTPCGHGTRPGQPTQKRNMVSAFFGLLLAIGLAGGTAEAYYGLRSQEANLEFQGMIDLKLPGNPQLAELNRAGSHARKAALEQIEMQIRHLRGAMQSKYYRKQFAYRGVIGENYDIRFTSQLSSSAQRQLVAYEFRGKAVMDKKLFQEGGSALLRQLPIIMPFQPDRIFTVSKGNQRRNFCMPAGITAEEEFWYYWDLSFPGCPLLKDGKPTEEIYVSSGELSPLPSTDVTCPQYDKLYDTKELKIAVFYGYVNSIRKHNNVNYRDANYFNMVELEKVIAKKWKFTKDEENSFDRFSVKKEKGIAYLHIWRGRLVYKGRTIPAEIKVVLADTDATSEDPTFHKLIAPALRETNIIIYDGHAGDDSHLGLSAEGLGVRHLPRDLYQIFFFNACYTYPYYNSMYFDAKGGRANAEIVTTGQETDTSMSVKNMQDFLEPFLYPRQGLSYQTILRQMERRLPKSVGPALYGVNGDEGKGCSR